MSIQISELMELASDAGAALDVAVARNRVRENGVALTTAQLRIRTLISALGQMLPGDALDGVEHGRVADVELTG